jgi:hypothetical protein
MHQLIPDLPYKPLLEQLVQLVRLVLVLLQVLHKQLVPLLQERALQLSSKTISFLPPIFDFLS